MRMIQLFFAAVALLGGSCVQAAVYNVTGSLTYWHSGAGYQEFDYPNGVPTFAGTLDDVSGAYNFIFAPFVSLVYVFNVADAAELTTSNQVFSGVGNGFITSTGTTVCNGAVDTCALQLSGALHGSFSFSISSNSISGVFTVLQSTVPGPYWQMYSFTGTAVPIPATVWLFGSSVVGLAALTRRRKVAVALST